MSKEPKYRVLESFGKIEIRFYEPFLIAEVETSGKRKEAIRAGFRLLADYLFGNNKASKRLPMSVPVTQQAKGDRWAIRFMLADESHLENLPEPNTHIVRLLQMPAQKLAVIQFSGFPNEEKLEAQTEKLRQFINANKSQIRGGPILAFYNPPWTLPFFRRNEIMFEIS